MPTGLARGKYGTLDLAGGDVGFRQGLLGDRLLAGPFQLVQNPLGGPAAGAEGNNGRQQNDDSKRLHGSKGNNLLFSRNIKDVRGEAAFPAQDPPPSHRQSG